MNNSNSNSSDQQQPQTALLDRRSPSTGHHPIIHHPDSGIEDRLQYLRDHRVCERLELMVRQLIHQRPEDPVLSLCAYLKEADRALGFVPGGGAASSSSSASVGGGLASPLSSASGATRQLMMQQPQRPASTSSTGAVFGASNNPNAAQQQQGGNLFTSTTARSLSPGSAGALQPQQQTQLSRFGSSSSLRSQPTSSNAAGSKPQATGLAAASSLPPLAVRNNATSGAGGANNFSETRSCGSVTSGRAASAAQHQQQQLASSASGAAVSTGRGSNGGGSAAGAAVAGAAAAGGVERDESARSDLSMFSVQSIDMGEFLSEFRAAHHSLFGGTKQRITFQDLADIVDRVAVPLPDTNMLAALYMDMERIANPAIAAAAAEAAEAAAAGGYAHEEAAVLAAEAYDASSSASTGVVFEGYLSRMAQRIQGRFTTESLAGLFLQLAAQQPGGSSSSARGTHAAGSMLQSPLSPSAQQQQVSFFSAPPPPPSAPGVSRDANQSPTHSARGGAGGGIHQSASSASLVIDAAILNPHPTGVRPSSSAASTDAAMVAHTTWVPARLLLDEGIDALGLRREDLPQGALAAIAQLAMTPGIGALPSMSSGSSASQQQQLAASSWSIQDFTRLANSAVSGHPMAMMSTPTTVTGGAGAAGGVAQFRFGGSLSNLGSVQDLTGYE